MVEVASLGAIEILDSRSRPTLWVSMVLTDGTSVDAGVPSGASTGSREAVELRDGDPHRFAGQGVTQAVASVNEELADLAQGQSWSSLEEFDHAMIELDGTANKARLGANAIVGVSMAMARAMAASAGQPLHAWLPSVGRPARLPVPCFNILNGGQHARNQLDFQEFMLCPIGATSIADAVRCGSEVYNTLKARLDAAGHPVGLGDEGGFAPDIAEPEDVLVEIVTAIEAAGYRPGRDSVAIALDPAASEFRQADGSYLVNGTSLSSDDMVERFVEIVDRFPVWSIEDGHGEDDDDGWKSMTARLGDRVQLVGDDNFCTNPEIVAAAIDAGIANASLIKLNQIGTVTETLETIRICHRAGYGQMVSHRSGETPDHFIADLTVGAGTGQLKTGAPARGERVAKYNRLIEIAATNPELPYGLP